MESRPQNPEFRINCENSYLVTIWCFSMIGTEKCHEGLYSGTCVWGRGELTSSTGAYFIELTN